MNKKIIVVLIALASVFSFSRGNEPKISFGARAGFVINSFTSGNSDFDDKVGIGMGFGAGGVLNYPITDIFFFSPEVGVYYRTLYNKDDKQEKSMAEVALSIPLMIQVVPLSIPLHVAAGVQIDFPFSSEEITTDDFYGEPMHESVENRKALDFGVAFGIGYRIIPNLGVDLRGVIGLTSLIDEDTFKDSSLKQYGIGVSYFF